jgi:signal transduction histidine kinase
MDACFSFLHTLRRLSLWKRMTIVLSSFFLFESLIAYVTYLRGSDRGVVSLLVLTGILAAWLFSPKSALLIEFLLMQVYLVVTVLISGWSLMLIVSFVAGIVTDLFLVATIGFLRHALDLMEVARQKEQHLLLLKDQFITNIHHELRSPLTGVLGSLELLRESDMILNEEERTFFLHQAIYGCCELQRITDNILDAMQADSDVSSPWVRTFSLVSVVCDVVRSFDMWDHSLFLDIFDEVEVLGDSQQVGQVMRNLLSNSLKYSPRNSSITVRVWKDDTYGYTCIKDTGPGIKADEIPLLFQKFSRLERDIAGPVRGIGLGLYICKKFIENMGGRIWVESTGIPGEGSSFCFCLPLKTRLSYHVCDGRELVSESKVRT